MFVTAVTRGVKAGVVAGLVFAVFVALVANPLVVYADGVHHDGHDHAHEGSGAAAVLSVGDAVSVLSAGLWAVLLGGVVFGAAFYLLEPLLPGTGATQSYLLGAAGFITVSGAPWLALPPAVPGVEQTLGTTTRLVWYGGMMASGAFACLLAGYAYDRLVRRHGRAVAVAGALAALATLVIPAMVAPSSATGGSLPATLQTALVGLVLFGQVLLWATLATAHAALGGGPEPSAAPTADSLGAD
jgi:predicted cobalt transporter CbtA